MKMITVEVFHYPFNLNLQTSFVLVSLLSSTQNLNIISLSIFYYEGLGFLFKTYILVVELSRVKNCKTKINNTNESDNYQRVFFPLNFAFDTNNFERKTIQIIFNSHYLMFNIF